MHQILFILPLCNLFREDPAFLKKMGKIKSTIHEMQYLAHEFKSIENIEAKCNEKLELIESLQRQLSELYAASSPGNRHFIDGILNKGENPESELEKTIKSLT